MRAGGHIHPRLGGFEHPGLRDKYRRGALVSMALSDTVRLVEMSKRATFEMLLLPFSSVANKYDIFCDNHYSSEAIAASNSDFNRDGTNFISRSASEKLEQNQKSTYLSRSVYFDPFLDINCSYLNCSSLNESYLNEQSQE